MSDELLLPGWKRRDEHNIEREIDADTMVAIHHYPGTLNQFCLHIIREGLRWTPKIVYGQANAYAECDRYLAMPFDEFKKLIIDKKLEDLHQLHQELHALGYESEHDEYAAGFKDGKQEMRLQIIDDLKRYGANVTVTEAPAPIELPEAA